VNALEGIYTDHRLYSRGAEPWWMKRLPDAAKRHLRRNYALTDGLEQFACMPTLPLSGIGYVVQEDGLVEATIRVFGLFRLGNIRQLSFLHDPVVHNVESTSIGMLFGHTRLGHSLDVAAVAVLIAVNNRIFGQLRRTLRVGATSHDALTPAGGDTTKLIDPPAFDEDANYANLLVGDGWEALREHYGLSAELLTDTVQGRGVLGAILDIADKVAYVARDASLYLGRYAPSGPVMYPAGYADVRAVIARRRFVCGVWDSVRVHGGSVFFEDGERLADFLLLRALLFRELYHHPGSRFLEYLVSRVVVQWLYDTGKLRRETLLRMTDGHLEYLVGEIIGESFRTTMISGIDHPRVETFDSLDAALRREHELRTNGTEVTLVDEFNPPAKSGTRLLVQRRGSILPFAEAHAERAAEIERIIRPEQPFRLYYYCGGTAFGPAFYQVLEHYRQRSRTLRECPHS
jgi:hypothetical protein